MIDWCTNHLTPRAPHFTFVHHDVWSPGYGRRNSFKLAEPFPIEDGAVSLFIANSVFTHVYKEQAEYYLCETSRILQPEGIALTSWFFFDNESFPFFRSGVPCLFVNELDPTAAVIYDRQWFVSMLRRCNLAVRKATHPVMAGHQWSLELEKRPPTSVEAFPLGEDQAEWVCGATLKPMAKPVTPPDDIDLLKVGDVVDVPAGAHGSTPPPPPLRGLPSEFAAAQRELATLKRRWAYRLRRAVGAIVRPVLRSSEER